jgi:hypothetical protein
VDCAAFGWEVDGYEGLVEAEEEEGLAEDGTGGEAVGVFVWDYEGSFVCFCAVAMCEIHVFW